ncbi:hypothetical protein CBM2609_B130078 [Cupriavidus taiwanensis]|nr:hypothetical protein CBM2604_B140075 [Cupriavidus taiwanensis]SOZ31528.1 hypothetical protein CBM2609_B130078 [Cupriavidus taiwanensis]
MVSGIRMLKQAPGPYCQQLSRKGDMEAACTLTAPAWADALATPALAVSMGRIDPRHAQPRHCPLPDFRTAALPPHEIFAFILLCMDAHAQAVNLPAVTGIVVYPHNVISAPDWPHPNAVGTVP